MMNTRQLYATIIGVRTHPEHEIIEKTCKIQDAESCMTAMRKRYETVFHADTRVGYRAD